VEKTLGKASLHRDGSGTSSFMLDGESLQDEVRFCLKTEVPVPTEAKHRWSGAVPRR